MWLQRKESNSYFQYANDVFEAEIKPTVFIYPLVDEDEDKTDHHTHKNDSEYHP